jgi:hypothetical protein
MAFKDIRGGFQRHDEALAEAARAEAEGMTAEVFEDRLWWVNVEPKAKTAKKATAAPEAAKED